MIEIRSNNQHSVRVVLARASGLRARLSEARRERANTIRALSRRRRTPEQIENDRAAVRRWHREHPEKVAEFKRRWREKRGAAYMRRYDANTPGRREYKAKWARDKRARERAALAAVGSKPQRSLKRHVLGLQPRTA